MPVVTGKVKLKLNSPITIVSSGISSMKHFLSVSAMWKYKAETLDKYKMKITDVR